MHIFKIFLAFNIGMMLLINFPIANANGFNQKPVVKKSSAPVSPPRKITANKSLSLSYFDNIQTSKDGIFTIEIQPGARRMEASGPGIAQLNSYVEDGVLHLNLLKLKDEKNHPIPPAPIYIRLWMPYVNQIDLSGNASLTANNISTRGLIIKTTDNSRVVLKGYIPVQEINASCDSYVNIVWVNSGQLEVEAHDNAKIYLAGTADLLAARIVNDALLDANHLRANTVLVQTHNKAWAQVYADKSLSAFADGVSNIYFYKKPAHYLDYTELSGNVLQMGNWQ